MPRRGWTNWVGVTLLSLFALLIFCLMAEVFLTFFNRITISYSPTAGQVQISSAAAGATTHPTATAVATAVPATPTAIAVAVPTATPKAQPHGCELHRFGSPTKAPEGSLVQPGGDQVAYVCSYANGSYGWSIYDSSGIGRVLSGPAQCPEKEMFPWGEDNLGFPQGTYVRPRGSLTTWLCGASGHFDEDP